MSEHESTWGRLAVAEDKLAETLTRLAEVEAERDECLRAGEEWQRDAYRAEQKVAALEAERDRLRETVRGHEDMRWPEEAHRLQQQRNALAQVIERVRAKYASKAANPSARFVRAQDVVDDLAAAPTPPAEAEAWSTEDRRDVAAWLIREADDRVHLFPQRRDGVDALLRHLAKTTRPAEAECAPGNGCTCLGHRVPGFSHMVPCCDEPHASGSPTPPTTDAEEAQS